LPHSNELCDDGVGCSSIGEEEKGYECDLETVQILQKPVLPMKLLNHSFMHTALLAVMNMNLE
jgi:hypothetical protein